MDLRSARATHPRLWGQGVGVGSDRGTLGLAAGTLQQRLQVLRGYKESGISYVISAILYRILGLGFGGCLGLVFACGG